MLTHLPPVIRRWPGCYVFGFATGILISIIDQQIDDSYAFLLSQRGQWVSTFGWAFCIAAVQSMVMGKFSPDTSPEKTKTRRRITITSLIIGLLLHAYAFQVLLPEF